MPLFLKNQTLRLLLTSFVI